MHKLEGPACCLTFLGITIDTEAMVLHLPEVKLARLGGMIQQWRARKACSKRELLSLIGNLQHVCRVVKPGRVFLCRMIDLASGVKELHHFVRLNKGFRSDLEWWALFLREWNGVSLMSTVIHRPRMHQVVWDVELFPHPGSGSNAHGQSLGQGFISQSRN